MSTKFSFNRKYRKALEAVVYLANKDQRQYWVLKAIYVADKEHLSRYGRQIFGDRYIAMRQGPVPSLAYDIVKSMREGATDYFFPDPRPNTALQIVPDNKTVKPISGRVADMNVLSESEIQCLDYGFNIVKDLTFEQLKQLTHDSAYVAADQNDDMSITKIVETLKNANEVLDYINNK